MTGHAPPRIAREKTKLLSVSGEKMEALQVALRSKTLEQIERLERRVVR